jgi:hypothetical protein
MAAVAERMVDTEDRIEVSVVAMDQRQEGRGVHRVVVAADTALTEFEMVATGMVPISVVRLMVVDT